MKRFFASGMKSTIRIWQRPKRVYYKLTAMLLVISVSGTMPSGSTSNLLGSFS
ncbi:MAG: hypothetical protein PHQ55_05960 [Eubacteriales bacterium]|nr:hypothetical protein [Eubacteriales bacterium]MDD3198100.1 hypothetical protein [Eubacteriales bacterium]MDD3504877.1 hypothetical protein [Eubacteriales bacterium]MDD4682698.1 hypothetical protein [Eubacteriales bacterium]